MAAIFTKEEYNYRNFNQINYFENKTISNNKRIRKEIKSDLEQLDKTLREFAIRKQKRYVIKGYAIIELLKEKMIVKLKKKQSFFRESYWKKKLNNTDSYTSPITKNGSRAGRWAKNFSIIF